MCDVNSEKEQLQVKIFVFEKSEETLAMWIQNWLYAIDQKQRKNRKYAQIHFLDRQINFLCCSGICYASGQFYPGFSELTWREPQKPHKYRLPRHVNTLQIMTSQTLESLDFKVFFDFPRHVSENPGFIGIAVYQKIENVPWRLSPIKHSRFCVFV